MRSTLSSKESTEERVEGILISGDNVENLTMLAVPDETNVTKALKTRFFNGKIYTKLGDFCLMAVNPYQHMEPSVQLSTIQKYIDEYKNPRERMERLDPHVFQTSADAYYRLRRLAEDQVIVFSGAHDSGKSTNRKLCITFLSSLSNHSAPKRIPGLIGEAQTILEAFGTTRNTHNTAFSQCTTLESIQYNARGHISGYHVDQYQFNKAHVIQWPKYESNFNIFSYFVYGANTQEHADSHIGAHDTYNYLGNESKNQSIKQRCKDMWVEFKAAFQALGFKPKLFTQIVQILSAILLLGNLVIVDETSSGGTIGIRNRAALENIAELLGVGSSDLEGILRYRTTVIYKERTSRVLTFSEANQQRHDLAITLYSLLIDHIVHSINKKLSRSDYKNRISLLDMPPPISNSEPQDIYHLGRHFMCEKQQEFLQNRIFSRYEKDYKEQQSSYSPLIYGLDGIHAFTSKSGIFAILNQPHENKIELIHKRETEIRNLGRNGAVSVPKSHCFVLQHYNESIHYSFETIYTANFQMDSHEEFSTLFCEGPTGSGSQNKLISELFTNDLNMKRFHTASSSSNLSKQSSKQQRGQSLGINGSQTVLETLVNTNNRLFASLDNSKVWLVTCLLANDIGVKNSFDSRLILYQLRGLQIYQIIKAAGFLHSVSYKMSDFCERYRNALVLAKATDDMSLEDQCDALSDDNGWDTTDMLIGSTKVFLSEVAWRKLEEEIREDEKAEKRQTKAKSGTSIGPSLATSYSLYDKVSSFDMHSNFSDAEASDYEGEVESTVVNAKSEKMQHIHSTKAPHAKTTLSRKLWVTFTWVTTWWIPEGLLSWVGRMKRSDMRMAWREKFTLCLLIFLLSASMIWFIAFFGHLVCPNQNLFSQSELQSRSSSGDGLISIRGEVFDLAKFIPRHWASEVIPSSALSQYAGKDISQLFPIQISALCDGITGHLSEAITLDNFVNVSDPNARFHDYRYFTDDYRPDWYFEKLLYLRKNYRLGHMGYDPSEVRYQASNPMQFGGAKSNRMWAILNGDVYDLTYYFIGGRSVRMPHNATAPSNVNLDFIDKSIAQLFKEMAGLDVSELFAQLPLNKDIKDRQLNCLRNVFFVGKVDARNSPQCTLSEYLLLIISAFLCSVIFFKFIAALHTPKMVQDQEFDKFIICQIPCYTEGEESIRKTVNSIATLKYDDNRKLIFIITDGMIVGSGNDKSTPRIVLDILGADESIEREALAYMSIGDGYKQHNMGKVYSGLYDYSGHSVPYIVVVKVGNISERQKPGNRGKRDSQMILMQFLNKVHYDTEMSPMEYEIYHQIQNVIGVNPFYYEFVLMVDADTEVLPDSLNCLISSFVKDDKVIGMCGETMLSNAQDTWITMIQVYEYYISHHLSKAFESLFGTVTCLPGCFCMYRIRSPGLNQALLVSNDVVTDYGDKKVDTLHKKNLLHLGEDRYLTTLILKHFPKYKTKFNANAACLTSAPDSWSVLLSQRRRWINSTIHNLGELVFLPQLCGFCCFSMRFIVILDLLSTLVMPAVVCYLGYLIYQLAAHTSQVPLMSLITLASVYGLQAIIFIVRRKWEHVGWLIIYILAIPAFSFFIPIYAYWHFDDFSWGNTRMVLDKQDNQDGTEEVGEFDPSSVSRKKWRAYEERFQDEPDHMIKQGKMKNEVDYGTKSYNIQSPPNMSQYPILPLPIAHGRSVHSMHAVVPRYSSDTSLATQLPSDEEIVLRLRDIIASADIMTITKSQIHQILDGQFGVDLANRRLFINKSIDEIIQDNFTTLK